MGNKWHDETDQRYAPSQVASVSYCEKYLQAVLYEPKVYDNED